MNRAETKYAGKFQLGSSGAVDVVAVEHNTVSMIRNRRTIHVKRWYLVLGCWDGKKTWFGKLATTGPVARAVKARMVR